MGSRVGIDHAATRGADVSRGTFLRRSAVAAAAVTGLYVAAPRRGRALTAETTGPKPIPGGFNASFEPVASNPAAHVFQPGHGAELNTIGDFNGFVAATEIQGKATGSDGTAYSFDCDMRFMHGSFVALDGQLRQGVFGFI